MKFINTSTVAQTTFLIRFLVKGEKDIFLLDLKPRLIFRQGEAKEAFENNPIIGIYKVKMESN